MQHSEACSTSPQHPMHATSLRYTGDLDQLHVYVPKAGGKNKAFVGLKDTRTAGNDDVASLYSQASTIASIAYLLYGAATPLAAAAPGTHIDTVHTPSMRQPANKHRA